MEEKANAVVEAVALVVAAEPKERSYTEYVVGAVDVDFFFVFHQLTETNELSLVQSLVAAQFQ